MASPHAILIALVEKGVRGKLLAWHRDYLLHRRARVKFQGVRSNILELENRTPQGGILSPFLFNLLMEQLVALAFQKNIVLLSYADDLALVVTGRSNKIRRTQQALDLISEKYEDDEGGGPCVTAPRPGSWVVMDQLPSVPPGVG